MIEPRVRGGIFYPDTPVSAIMSALFGTDPNDPETLAVEQMSDEEIEREAREIRERYGVPQP